MTNSSNLISILKPTMATAGAAVMSFVGPVIPYGWICTAMVAADFISARMLARRIRKRVGALPAKNLKFSSRRFGATVISLGKIYALLLLAHGVDRIIIGEEFNLSLLRFAAALVCFWQFWSILENEASANDAPWARIASKILVDKTARHLGIDLSDLRHDSDHPCLGATFVAEHSADFSEMN